MSTSLEFSGESSHIILKDTFDFTVQDDFQQIIDEIADRKAIKKITVDMADVNFIDSSGIRMLLLLNKKAVSTDRSLILINCPDGIREIFAIGGFDRVLSIR